MKRKEINITEESTSTDISEDLSQIIIESIDSGLYSIQAAATQFNLPRNRIEAIYKRFLNRRVINKTKKSSFLIKNNNNYDVSFKDKVIEKQSISPTCVKKELEKNHFTLQLNQEKKLHFKLEMIRKDMLSSVTPDLIVERKLYCKYILNLLQESSHLLIFLDERAFKVTKKQKCDSEALSTSFSTVTKTVMVSMTKQEVLYYKVIDGSINSFQLKLYINELLTSLRTRSITSAVIVVDNELFEWCPEIKDMIERAQQLILIRAAYIKGLNPTEVVFSQWACHIESSCSESNENLESYIESFSGVVNSYNCFLCCNEVYENAIACLTGATD